MLLQSADNSNKHTVQCTCTLQVSRVRHSTVCHTCCRMACHAEVTSYPRHKPGICVGNPAQWPKGTAYCRNVLIQHRDEVLLNAQNSGHAKLHRRPLCKRAAVCQFHTV